MTQHTPGPWETINDGFYLTVVDRMLKVLARFKCGNPVDDANARLIANAPEMRQILERLVSTDHFTNAPSELADDARALLQEIEGQS